MATTVTPPAASSPPSSASVFDQIGAALNEPASEPSQAAASSPPEQPAETPPESTPEPTPELGTGENAEVQAEAPAAEPEPENPYEDTADSLEQPQTLQAILATRDGKKMLANHKIVKELAKPFEQGGIGHIPTVQQARDYYGAYRDRIIMDHDISSGDPAKVDRWINHYFGQRQDGTSRPNVDVVAAHLAPTLAKSNPEVYAAAAQPFIQNYGNALWDRWAEAKDPVLKEALYQAAQRVHKDITGKWRTDVTKPVTAEPGAEDPLAQDRAEIAQERQQIQQERQQGQQAAVQQWEVGVNSKIDERLGQEIDKALGPLKTMHENAPRVYAALKRDFLGLVMRGASSDKFAWDVFQTRIAEARRARPQDPSAIVNEYLKLATPAITANRKQFLEEAGAIAKQQSDARHTELRSIDSKKAPTSNGSAPKPGAGAPLQRLPGESAADYNHRQVKAILR